MEWLERLETFAADLLVLDLRIAPCVSEAHRYRCSSSAPHRNANIAEDTMAQGAAAYMLKPFDPDALQATVAELLAGESG